MGVVGIQQNRKSGHPMEFKMLRGDSAFHAVLFDSSGRINSTSLAKNRGESKERFWTRFCLKVLEPLEEDQTFEPVQRPPLAVLDLETTGLPGLTPADVLRVIEVAVVITDWKGEVMREMSVLVNPGIEILRDPATEPSFRITGIDRDAILARGIPYDEMPDRLLSWFQRRKDDLGLTAATSFGRTFDFGGFLDLPPWSIKRAGLEEYRCLHRWGAQLMFGRAKARGTKLADVAKWLRDRGYDVPVPPSGHRALWDARVAAGIEAGLSAEGTRAGSGSPG